ncbi:hypothetical protein HYV43_04495 [Candidatus Micrarchaeota archaeon]|nr:hypothetical protein [Candidatus Micrarchaeota archaeon]
MERNIYGGLLGLAVLGLLLNFEWLFLTFLLLTAGLFLAERFSAPSYSNYSRAGPVEYSAGPAPMPPVNQQPIVIQSATQSPSSNMMMDMISNLVQESATYHRPNSPWKKMTGQMDKIGSRLKKMEHTLDHLEKHAKQADKDGHGGGHH